MGISFVGAVLFWIPTVLLCGVVVVAARRRRRGRGWLRPSSFVALGCVALLNAATVWLVGFSRAGLDLRESCESRSGVRFDDAWNDVHYAESQRFFPLHAKCSASVDLVPAWINPAVIALVLLFVGCLGAAGWLGVRHVIREGKKTHV